jgi:hypothetical protein
VHSYPYLHFHKRNFLWCGEDNVKNGCINQLKFYDELAFVLYLPLRGVLHDLFGLRLISYSKFRLLRPSGNSLMFFSKINTDSTKDKATVEEGK